MSCVDICTSTFLYAKLCSTVNSSRLKQALTALFECRAVQNFIDTYRWNAETPVSRFVHRILRCHSNPPYRSTMRVQQISFHSFFKFSPRSRPSNLFSTWPCYFSPHPSASSTDSHSQSNETQTKSPDPATQQPSPGSNPSAARHRTSNPDSTPYYPPLTTHALREPGSSSAPSSPPHP